MIQKYKVRIEDTSTAARTADTMASMNSSPSIRQTLAALRDYAAVNQKNFAGENLTSLRTSRLQFTDCSFVGADLRHATLDGCRFKLCNLRGANFRGASLREVRLVGCDLRDADLRDTDLTDAHFGSVNTGTPPLGLTNATGARFDGAALGNFQAEGVVGWSFGDK